MKDQETAEWRQRTIGRLIIELNEKVIERNCMRFGLAETKEKLLALADDLGGIVTGNRVEPSTEVLSEDIPLRVARLRELRQEIDDRRRELDGLGLNVRLLTE